jgi:peptidyl-prolyl cis-trans isomerase SurA
VLVTVLLLAAGAPPAAAETIEQVLAVVGKEPILLSEAQTQLAMAIEGFGVDASDSAAVAELRDSVLEELIDQELLYQESQAQGVYVSEEAVTEAAEEMLARSRAGFGSEEMFQLQLRREGLTLQELRERFVLRARKEIAISHLLRRRFPEDPDVTSEQLRRFFDEHRAELPRREAMVHLQHILISAAPDPLVRQKSFDLAREVAARIRAGELTFAEAAARYSDDPNGRRGGELGRVRRGDFRDRMGGAFEDTLFALGVDELSTPQASPLGYHLLLITERSPNEDWVQARHILFGVPIVRADEARAEERAQEAFAELQSGVLFEDVARAYSDDALSAPEGGNVGWVPLSALRGDLEIVRAIVDTLAVGATSRPVPGDGAFHIFRLLGRDAERAFMFEEIREELIDYVRAQRQQEAYRGWLEELRQEYYVERRDWPAQG